MVLIKKFIFNFKIIKNDKKNEIIKNNSKFFLFLSSDFIHFNFGPIAITNKKGIKKGTINLL